MKTFENIKFKIIVILFLVLLVTPNAIQILDLEKNIVQNENRAAFPEFKLSNPIHFIKSFKTYYLDNFGSKKILANSYIKFKTETLNENPIPNRVLKGKEDWLFLGNHYNDVLKKSFGHDTFTNKELEQTIYFFKELKNYFNSKNIAFYVVVPPDKNRIYQEFLPYTLKQKKTQLEILKNELKINAGIEVIDLLKPLLSKKEESSRYLYYKQDTHWNYFGAYIGYSTIIDEIKKQNNNVTKIPFDSFTVNESKLGQHDLAKMINLKEEQTRYIIEKKDDNEVEKLKIIRRKIHIRNKTKSHKVILYRDSFTNALYPFFNQTFLEIIYNKDYSVDKTEIETFKPDIVIFEIIERNIDTFAKMKPFQ